MRVPQSLLFAGPDGVGKRTVALALAQAVNCPNRTDGDACGTCSTCDRIARGLHSDVTLIDTGDEASIKIRTLRERVLDALGYRPFEAERRVYIVDQADALHRRGAGRAAQDARGAAVVGDPHARHGVSRHAAADDSVALPAPAIRPARRS